jgi:hypothetical protein
MPRAASVSRSEKVAAPAGVRRDMPRAMPLTAASFIKFRRVLSTIAFL